MSTADTSLAASSINVRLECCSLQFVVLHKVTMHVETIATYNNMLFIHINNYKVPHTFLKNNNYVSIK